MTDPFLNLVSVIAFCLLIGAMGIVIWLGRKVANSSPTLSQGLGCRYYLTDSLVTAAEKKFLICLDSVSPKEVRIFAKVRIADILSVGASVNRSAWQTGFNKINSKHVDFLVCRASDFSPILVIELDDSTHQKEARRDRDNFLNAIFAEVKLPILRIQVQPKYDSQDLAKRLNAVFQPVKAVG